MVERDFDVTSMTNRRVWRANRVCMGDIVERTVWAYPNKEALVALEGAYGDEENKRLTYRQANDKINQLANAFLAEGLNQGDRVLICASTSVETALVCLGVAKAGLVAVPINTMYSADLLEYVVKTAEARFVVLEAEFYPRVAEIIQRNNLKVGMTIPIGGGVVEGSKSFREFVAGQPIAEPEADIQPNDIYLIMFTSGTTAMPKGAMLSHLNCYLGFLDYGVSIARGTLLENEVIGLNAYPYYHIGGQKFTYSPICMGGKAVIVRSPYPHVMAEAITQEKITAVLTSPAGFYSMVELAEKEPDKYDLSSLRVAFHGWGPMRPDYEKRLRKLAPHVLVSSADGQTEHTAVDQRFWYHLWYEKFEKNAPATNYFGLSTPIQATTIMRADVDDVMTEPFEIGEKVMRGPTVMHAYYKDQDSTRKCFTPQGWLRGGDGGYLDEEGVTVFADRIKDVIKTGGENVVSGRVEEIVKMHPKVENAAVVGLSHKYWGEAVTACVVVKPGEELTAEELISYCKTRLSGFEVPKKVVFLEALPETVGGKIQKFRLREMYKDLYAGEEK